MKPNERIYIKRYLNDLNLDVDKALRYGRVKKDYILKLSCKTLAEKCEVTQATLSNLTTSSKFYLIYRIAEEIYDAYYSYFNYVTDERRKAAIEEDEFFLPYDISYIIYTLTEFYTDLWVYEDVSDIYLDD